MPSLKRIKISMEKSFLAQKNMVIILAGNLDEGDEGHKILEAKKGKTDAWLSATAKSGFQIEK